MLLSEITLNEVFVFGDKANTDGKTVLAFQQWIWILDSQEAIDDANEKLGVKYYDAQDFEELAERDPRIIFGMVNGWYLSIYSIEFRQSSGSTTLQKMLKALDLRGVTVGFNTVSGDIDEFIERREETIAPLAQRTFYHGTNYTALQQISKVGLAPTGKSNFTDIIHADKVFVSTNKEKAMFHASNTAEKTNSIPIILEISIPDVNKLVLDYDVALAFYTAEHNGTITLGYSDIHNYATRGGYSTMVNNDEIKQYVSRIRKDPDALNTQLGIFGYLGRIPTKFITGILVDTDKIFQLVDVEEFGGDFADHDTELQPIRNWDQYDFRSLVKKYDMIHRERASDYEDDEY